MPDHAVMAMANGATASITTVITTITIITIIITIITAGVMAAARPMTAGAAIAGAAA